MPISPQIFPKRWHFIRGWDGICSGVVHWGHGKYIFIIFSLWTAWWCHDLGEESFNWEAHVSVAMTASICRADVPVSKKLNPYRVKTLPTQFCLSAKVMEYRGSSNCFILPSNSHVLTVWPLDFWVAGWEGILHHVSQIVWTVSSGRHVKGIFVLVMMNQGWRQSGWTCGAWFVLGSQQRRTWSTYCTCIVQQTYW